MFPYKFILPLVNKTCFIQIKGQDLAVQERTWSSEKGQQNRWKNTLACEDTQSIADDVTSFITILLLVLARCCYDHALQNEHKYTKRCNTTIFKHVPHLISPLTFLQEKKISRRKLEET